ncbi:hypothetical protein ABZS66_36290 [Dactylosporangium sp. NPDC005572]|uniref:hypothetical protein n=1 Tax=Dactylosporangium sp. NPDC005572 TaxID=3156889 RepID=UPI0033AF1382
MGEVRHTYSRPTWVCTVDGEPWPCEARKAKFRTDYVGERTRLRMMLGAHFSDAMGDFADAGKTSDDIEALRKRFFDWVPTVPLVAMHVPPGELQRYVSGSS